MPRVRRKRVRHAGPSRRRSYARRRYKAVRSFRRMLYKGRRSLPVIAPPSYRARLFYGEYSSLQTGAGPTIATRVFRHNNLRDPDFTGVGGSCSGWNELTALYEVYRVLGSKVEVWVYNTCASPIIFAIHALNSHADAYLTGTELQQAYLERADNCRAIELVPYVTGNGIPVRHLSMYRSTRQLEGRAYRDTDYSASVASDPSIQTWWHLSVACTDGTTSSITCNYRIRITYYVEFTQRASTVTD